MANNENNKLTNADKDLANGKIYFGTYTFLIKALLDTIESIADLDA
jgi:hypothetical protein